MRMGQLNHEPSMEDILASIKRIIAEDSEAVGAKTPKARREAMAAVAASPVIAPEAAPEIAQAPTPVASGEPTPEPVAEARVEDGAPSFAAEPEPAVLPGADLDADSDESPDILELTSPMPEADAIPAPAAKAAPSTASTPTRDTATEGLVSSPAAQASRNAFAALGQMQVRVEEGAPNTLDGLVADLLKPMLREWLDHNLPPLVERLVSAEVARLSGRG